MECVFCQIKQEQILFENEFAFVILDKFPKTPGHTLVVLKRHISSFEEITDEESIAVNQLLQKRLKELRDTDDTILGFNVRVNIGAIAGQTVMHCHFHLVPRRKDDGLGLLGG